MIADMIAKVLIGVAVGLLVALPTSLLLISLMRKEPIPWQEYLACLFGKRPQE